MNKRFKVGDIVRSIDTGFCFTIEEIRVGRNGRYSIWSSELHTAYYDMGGIPAKNWHNPLPKFIELVTHKTITYTMDKHRMI